MIPCLRAKAVETYEDRVDPEGDWCCDFLLRLLRGASLEGERTSEVGEAKVASDIDEAEAEAEDAGEMGSGAERIWARGTTGD